MVNTTVDFFPLGCGLLIVCILGLIGNCLSAAVLQRPKMKSTYSILTLGLTFCDFMYLLMKLLRYGLLSLFQHFSIAKSYREIFYPTLGPWMRALTFTAHMGSTYFTVALAVDRYISVCWPVKARFLCTKRRAYILATFVLLFAIVYNIPRWLEFHTELTIHYDEELGANVTVLEMKVSDLRNNPLYKSLYIFWSYFLLLFCVPFTSLTFFNFKIFREVRESNRTRRKLTSFQQREISFAIMLISIVVLFLVCSTDYLVLDLLSYLDIKYSAFWDELGNFLLTLNSAGNFIIYCVFGRRFRNELIAMTKQNWCGNGSSSNLSSRAMIPDLISGNDGESSQKSKFTTRYNSPCNCGGQFQ